MTTTRDRLPEALVALLGLGALVTSIHPPALPVSTPLRFVVNLASTYHWGYRMGGLLMLTGIEPIAAGGTCPSRLLLHLSGCDLDGSPWTHPSEPSILKARVSLHLTPFMTDQEVAACTAQSRNSRLD